MTVLLKNLFTVHFQFDLLKLETNNTRDDKLKHACIIGCSVYSVRKSIPRSGETDHGQTAWLSASVEPSPDPESAAVERRISVRG